jgi:hypothetical protein
VSQILLKLLFLNGKVKQIYRAAAPDDGHLKIPDTEIMRTSSGYSLILKLSNRVMMMVR